jgi:hypothetical protein
MLLMTFFTPRTSLANLPAMSFAAALLALPSLLIIQFLCQVQSPQAIPIHYADIYK